MSEVKITSFHSSSETFAWLTKILLSVHSCNPFFHKLLKKGGLNLTTRSDKPIKMFACSLIRGEIIKRKHDNWSYRLVKSKTCWGHFTEWQFYAKNHMVTDLIQCISHKTLETLRIPWQDYEIWGSFRQYSLTCITKFCSLLTLKID